jgi:hypothetical protein
MNTILLALIAGMMLARIVNKSEGGEVWAEYFMILLASVIILVIAFSLNALAAHLGITF